MSPYSDRCPKCGVQISLYDAKCRLCGHITAQEEETKQIQADLPSKDRLYALTYAAVAATTIAIILAIITAYHVNAFTFYLLIIPLATITGKGSFSFLVFALYFLLLLFLFIGFFLCRIVPVSNRIDENKCQVTDSLRPGAIFFLILIVILVILVILPLPPF